METAEYEMMYRVEECHWWYRALHRLVFRHLTKHLPHWKTGAVLDAGCGTGAILKQLGDRGQHLGVDLSECAVSFCEKRGLRNVLKADIAKLPMSSASVDAVICSSVLYHRWVPDVESALRELHRVTRDGGFLLLNLPAFDCLHSPHDDAVFGARRFTRPEVIKLLEGHGFSVRFCSYWTALLFPFAWAARFLRLSRKGRDFEQENSLRNAILNRVMDAELWLLQRVSMPFGVALFCVAQKKSS